MTKYTNQTLKDQIVSFISINPGVKYTQMKETLAKRFHVSTNRINDCYQEIKKDGLIDVKSISQMKGGHEGHELTLRDTSVIQQLKNLDHRLGVHEYHFHNFFPTLRNNKIMITQKNGMQVISKRVESDLGIVMFTLDNYFYEIASFSLMKSNDFISKEYGEIILQLERRVIEFIIKSINDLLDQESKPSKKSRANLLIYLRQNLKWLNKFESQRPDLFFKGKIENQFPVITDDGKS